MERCRARTKTHCVPCADPRCKGFFERANFGSGREPIRSQHVDDSPDIIFIERLPTVGEQRLANGRCPVDGQQFPANCCHTHLIFYTNAAWLWAAIAADTRRPGAISPSNSPPLSHCKFV